MDRETFSAVVQYRRWYRQRYYAEAEQASATWQRYEKHPEGEAMAALRAEGTPGRCLACDAPLPREKGKRQRTVCDNPECKRVRAAAYRQDRSRREGRRRAPP